MMKSLRSIFALIIAMLLLTTNVFASPVTDQNLVKKPIIELYSSSQFGNVLYIHNQTSGAIVTYTLDGSEPNNRSKQHDGCGILLPTTTTMTITVKAKAFKAWVGESGTTTLTLKINPVRAAAPTSSHKSGTYLGIPKIKLACETVEASIRYTTDGTEPTVNSPLYKSTLGISLKRGTTTIKAKTFRPGIMLESNTVTFTYKVID